MIPLGTDIRLKQGFPKATIALVLGMGLIHAWRVAYGVNNIGWDPWAIYFNDHFEFFGLFAHMFSHANWPHYIFNMIFFWPFAVALEDRLGPGRFFLLYVAVGFGATLVHMLVSTFISGWPPVGLIGASGAITGVIGLCVARFRQGRVKILFSTNILILATSNFKVFYMPLTWFAAFSLLPDILQAFNSHSRVAHLAHLGGFAAGLLCAGMLRLQKDDYTELALDDAKRDIELGIMGSAVKTYNRLQRMGIDNAEIRMGLALCMTIPLRRHAMPTPSEKAEAARKMESAISLLLKEGRDFDALKLYRDHGPFFGEDRFALKDADKLKSLSGLAAEAGLRPMDEQERTNRLGDAGAALLQAASNNDWEEAWAQAERLDAVSDPPQWDAAQLLAAGLAAAKTQHRKQALEWLPLIMRKGDVDQCMTALLAIAQFTINTPAQADLARYSLQAKNRWDYKIEERQDWIDLHARMKRV